MEHEIECPNCSEIQKKSISFEGVNYQCICVECENEFYVYKHKNEIFIDMADIG